MAKTRSRIIRIGNSHGLRIPKTVLESLSLKVDEDVTLSVQRGTLVVEPARRARAGWEEAFERMARRGDDALLDSLASSTAWDDDEWKW